MELIKCTGCGFAEEIKEVGVLYDDWYSEVGEFQALDIAAAKAASTHSDWLPQPNLVEKMEVSIGQMGIIYSRACDLLKRGQKVCYGEAFAIVMSKVGIALDCIIGVVTIAVMFINVFSSREASDAQLNHSLTNFTTASSSGASKNINGMIIILCFNAAGWGIRDWLCKRAKDSMKVMSLLEELTLDQKGSHVIEKSLSRLKMWKLWSEFNIPLKEPLLLISKSSSSKAFTEKKGSFDEKQFRNLLQMAFEVGFFVLFFVDIYLDSIEKSNLTLKAIELALFTSLFVIARLNDYLFLSKRGF